MIAQNGKAEAALESRCRRLARRQRLAIRKSRARVMTFDNQGGYRIYDPYYNRVEAGEHFELSLEDVAHYFES